MDDLLSFVLDANGGLDRWAKASVLTADVSVGGAFWGRQGWPGILGGETVTLDTRREHIELAPLGGPGRSSVFDTGPERLAILAADGTVVGQRDDPRASFAGFDRTTPWDLIQTTYFISYAMWNYLTSPFLFTYPGVETKEIEPWQENGQTWRALAVTFPDTIATHSTEQIFYFDATGKQQRLDYQPAVNGNTPVAPYTDDHRTFDGIVFPTRRRIYRRNADRTADKSEATITLDLDSITLA
jgi:hypothetical protein